jgi:hypothetical protein
LITSETSNTQKLPQQPVCAFFSLVLEILHLKTMPCSVIKFTLKSIVRMLKHEQFLVALTQDQDHQVIEEEKGGVENQQNLAEKMCDTLL